MKKFLIVLICISGITRSGLNAQTLPPIQTDRPDQTECPFIVPKNYFQMENGFSSEHNTYKTDVYLHPSSLLKYGVNDQWELRMITEITSVHHGDQKESGLKPVKIGFKTKMTEENGIIPKISFIGHLSIPDFASEEFQSLYYAPTFRFTLQHSLSDKLSLGYNLGGEWYGFTAEPTFIYTLTTGYSINDKFGSYLEIYGFFPQFAESDHRVDGGINYLLNENFLLDLSGGAGLTSNAPEYYVALGISFRLKT